jgi:hypothetical protein
MKTPGATGGSTKRSPLAPAAQLGRQGQFMSFDDASSQVMVGELRARGTGGVGGSDAANGLKGAQGRTATNASAQFRITGFHPAPPPQEARATLANGRTMSPVMGTQQRGNFDAQRGVLG